MTRKPTSPSTARKNLVAKNSLFNLMGQSLPLIAGFAAIPPVLNYLGPERFGVLSIAWAILGYFTMFDFGVSRAVTKFVAAARGSGPEGDRETAQIYWSGLAVQLAVGALGTIFIYLTAPWLVGRLLKLSPELTASAEQAFRVLAFFPPLVLLQTSFRGMLEGAQRFDLVNLVKTPAVASTFVIPLFALPFSLDLSGIFDLLLISRLLIVGVYCKICFNVFPGLFPPLKPDRAVLKKLLTFGGWLTVSNFLGPIFAYLERLFIGSLISMSALAFYTAPFEVISRVIIVPLSISMALFPALCAQPRAGYGAMSRVFTGSLKYIFLIMTPVCLAFFVFSDPLLDLWLGPEYAVQAGLVLKILAVKFYIHTFAYLPLTAVQALGRPDLKAKLDMAVLPIFVGCCFVLLPWLGLPGAAWAKFIITLIDTGGLFLMAAYVAKQTVFEMLNSGPLKKAALHSLGLIAAVLLTELAPIGLWPRIGLDLVWATGFVVLFALRCLEDGERAALRRAAVAAHVCRPGRTAG